MPPLDVAPLLARAFLVAPAPEASRAIAEARAAFASSPVAKSFSYEIVVPDAPELAWLEAVLVRRLVYHCESTRSPLPACAGVFVSFFSGDRLHCVAAAEVIAFARERLGRTDAELVARFGTGEVRYPLRDPVALLPPPEGKG